MGFSLNQKRDGKTLWQAVERGRSFGQQWAKLGCAQTMH